MAIKQINPYLNFNGTASQAIALYERALGAKPEHVMRYSDAPGTSPADKDRIMHSVLRIGAGQLMAGDGMPGSQVTAGNNNSVCLDFDDVADMTQKFNALSEGGTVDVPLQDTFWGAKFGMLTDAFGINWMFNCMTRQA